ncbi:hypothetical protein OIU77_001969 [Salix suchowensis]|uniref:INACTIVE SHIKIMATE KINASE LIKE 1 CHLOROPLASTIC-RELATED n=2 Tax=Salix TaxID=40685 RepID=A0A9Q0PNE9_9ROSI|nr:hypothetical protein OIU78_025929 [Salix suchowensis]KAJ6290107.1 hypothetical protein OIU78_025929 [Salix suchowensis]KAJ6371564.1 hypothetical protein OIU77_001969 [Salix suchowensis]KAJ6691251.1 INACTIVE SHIKIMATE KINASE LIKE 1 CHLOROPLASTIC-RELATED [Salix koriyanagi]KAJ6691252.1 INACTIVE SHIKIMATE KINASE LIKE 1 CHLOROPLASTIC-RELATED [Salix koriyanagi]
MEITTATATATLAAAIPNLSLSSLSSTIKPRPRPHSHSRFSKFPIVSRPTSLTTICSLRNETATSTTKVAGDDTTLQVKKRAADLSPELKGTSIFILGMRGPIKTDLGKLLADALRYYYFDSDSLVEEAAGGESAAKSLKERDEKGFRESETEVLKQLTSMGRLVVCAGDGAVQNSTNLGLLRHGISLWIDVPLDIVARGMVEDKTQLAASDSHSEVLEQLVATYEKLRAGYATADAKISLSNIAVKLGYDELDSVTTEDLTLEVVKEIEKLTRVKKMMEEAARPF